MEATASGDGGASYLEVVRASNTLLYNIGKNVWSKYFPNEIISGGKLDLQFGIEPGDSTPRRVMVCLARQLHNFKCVAKILERVREAEKMLQNLDDDESSDGDEVNTALLSDITSQLKVLTKCESAMQRRHSVRHRVLPVAASNNVTCVSLCDIQCPLLDISLSQLESYSLLDNSNRQLWLIEEPQTGHRQRVPPLFLAAEPDTGELARIGRAKAGLTRAAGDMAKRLAGQLLGSVKSLESLQDEIAKMIAATESLKSFESQLHLLEKFLTTLAKSSEAQELSRADYRALLEAIDFFMSMVQVDSVANCPLVVTQLLEMQAGLGVLKTFARAQEAAGLLRTRDLHGGSRRSFRSGRSHPLSTTHRRTSMFEFEFEFVESTRKRSSAVVRRVASSTDVSQAGSSRFSSETVTRQRQEVARKFVIQSVWDGQKEVSLEDALAAGVVDFKRGVYVELLGSRVEMPLEAAMSAGKIRVELVTSQQVSEDSSSFGLISVEETHQTDDGQATTSSVSYVVHAVVDVAGRRKLSFQEAAQLGLIDRGTGTFTNSDTGEILPPGEAIKRGFFKAYTVDDPRSLDIEPENRITVKNINKLKSRWSAVSAFAKAAGKHHN